MTSPTQAEIDAAVKLAKDTVACEHGHKTHWAQYAALQLARALLALAAEREWRPIESAPRDGTWILIAGNSGYNTTPLRVSVARYYPEYRPHNPWQTHSDDAFTDGGDLPIYWLPLPKPPTPDGEQS